MSMSQWGLIADIVGVLFLALETFLKTRGIRSDSFIIGGGPPEGLLLLFSAIGYPLLIIGFVLQLIGSKS